MHSGHRGVYSTHVPPENVRQPVLEVVIPRSPPRADDEGSAFAGRSVDPENANCLCSGRDRVYTALWVERHGGNK